MNKALCILLILCSNEPFEVCSVNLDILISIHYSNFKITRTMDIMSDYVMQYSQLPDFHM